MKKYLFTAIMLVVAGSLMAQEPIVWKEVVITPASLDSIKDADQLSHEVYLQKLDSVSDIVKVNLQNAKEGLDEAKERKKSVDAEDKLIDQERKNIDQDNKLLQQGIKGRQSQIKNFDKQIKTLNKNKEMSDAMRQSQITGINNQKAELERQNQTASKSIDANKNKSAEIEKRNTVNADKQASVNGRIQELTTLIDGLKNEDARLKNEIKVVKARIKADKKMHDAEKQ